MPAAHNPEPVERIAAHEYQRRRSWLSGEISGGRMAEDEASERLLPWLHIAALAGADIPAVYEDGIHIYPWDRAGQPARTPLVLSLSPDQRTAALAELARVRDAAVGASEHDTTKVVAAWALVVLARHLGAPPMAPIQEAA